MLTLYGNNSFVFTACPDSAKWQKKMKKQKKNPVNCASCCFVLFQMGLRSDYV